MRDDYGTAAAASVFSHPAVGVYTTQFISGVFYQRDDRLLLFQSPTQSVHHPQPIIFCSTSTKMHIYTQTYLFKIKRHRNRGRQRKRWMDVIKRDGRRFEAIWTTCERRSWRILLKCCGRQRVLCIVSTMKRK